MELLLDLFTMQNIRSSIEKPYIEEVAEAYHLSYAEVEHFLSLHNALFTKSCPAKWKTKTGWIDEEKELVYLFVETALKQEAAAPITKIFKAIAPFTKHTAAQVTTQYYAYKRKMEQALSETETETITLKNSFENESLNQESVDLSDSLESEDLDEALNANETDLLGSLEEVFSSENKEGVHGFLELIDYLTDMISGLMDEKTTSKIIISNLESELLAANEEKSSLELEILSLRADREKMNKFMEFTKKFVHSDPYQTIKGLKEFVIQAKEELA
jgi:hypothetical protein